MKSGCNNTKIYRLKLLGKRSWKRRFWTSGRRGTSRPAGEKLNLCKGGEEKSRHFIGRDGLCMTSDRGESGIRGSDGGARGRRGKSGKGGIKRFAKE